MAGLIRKRLLRPKGWIVTEVLVIMIFLAGCGGTETGVVEPTLTPMGQNYAGGTGTSAPAPDVKNVKDTSEAPLPTIEPKPNPEDLLKHYRTVSAYTEIRSEELKYLSPEELFYEEEITDALFNRIYGKSWKEDCTVPREELRYLRILHIGAGGETRVGELICNRLLAGDLLDIFEELYRQKYPVERVVLIDEYGADDQRSMEANNTSCFNFRKVPDSKNLSKHAAGRAIDINPLYNPYVRIKDGETICDPENGIEYMDRSREFPYKISEEDLCYQLFIEHGFEWGGNWYSSKDYQHFQK